MTILDRISQSMRKEKPRKSPSAPPASPRNEIVSYIHCSVNWVTEVRANTSTKPHSLGAVNKT